MNKSEDYGMKAVRLAGKGQEVFVPAVFAIHSGKALAQVTAIQIPMDNLLDIGAEKSILPLAPLLIDLNKGFKMVLDTPVVVRRWRVLWTVNGGGSENQPLIIFTHQVSPLIHRY